MTEVLWDRVDEYLGELFVPPDTALDAAVRASDEAGLPPIQVSPTQGKLLHLLARVQGARRILEIGTLGGYSTIWLGRALPMDGHLVTLEADPRHAEVARANIERAGLSDRVEIRVGPALETLPELAEQEPFDLSFIDADKRNNPAYTEHALSLSRPGSIIVVDNVVREGEVLTAGDDPDLLGVRGCNELLATHPRLDATAIQTVGVKGYDGFAVALVAS
jgi:predicted O-methyltransferase YrrM